MARRFTILAAIALGLASVPLAASTALADHESGNHEKTVTLDQVPEAARATIQKEIADGTLEKIELEQEHGQSVYEVKIKPKAGGELKVEVTPDGKIVKRTEKHPH